MNENPPLSQPTGEPGNTRDDDQPLADTAGGGQSPVPPAPPRIGSHWSRTGNWFDEATDEELEEYLDAHPEQVSDAEPEGKWEPDEYPEPDDYPDEMIDSYLDGWGGDEGD